MIIFELPLCKINLDKNSYKEKVKHFYKKGGEKEVEEFKLKIKEESNLEIKSLQWDKHLGLTNINNIGGGLDLDISKMRYLFHNIGYNSDYEAVLFKIAKKYIDLLMK